MPACSAAPMGPNFQTHVYEPLGEPHGDLWAQGATIGRVGPLNNQVKMAVGPIGPDHADLLRWVRIFKHTYTNPLANCMATCGLKGPLSAVLDPSTIK